MEKEAYVVPVDSEISENVAPGWEPGYDDEGNLYYYNAELDESRWAADVPLALPDDATSTWSEGPKLPSIVSSASSVIDDDGLDDDFIEWLSNQASEKFLQRLYGQDWTSALLTRIGCCSNDDSIPDYKIPKPWKPPTSRRAEEKAKEIMFEQGTGDFFSTGPHDFEDLGAGVWLYFAWLRGLIVCFIVVSIFQVPAILLCMSGEGIAEENKDSLGIYKFTLGNVGPGSQADNGLFDTKFTWLGSEYLVQDTGPLLATFSTLGIFFALIPFWLWSRSRTTTIAQEVQNTVLKAEDYTVFVSNVPKDLNGWELASFLSNIVDPSTKTSPAAVANTDYQPNRKLPFVPALESRIDAKVKTAINCDDFKRICCELRRESNLEEVDDSFLEEVFLRVDDRKQGLLNVDDFKEAYSEVQWYGNSVADVELVYSDAEAIHAFIERQKKMEELIEVRALVKMYANGSAHSNAERFKLNLKKEGMLSVELDKIAVELAKHKKLEAKDLNVIGAFVTFNSAVAADRCITTFKEVWKNRKLWRRILCCKKVPPDLLFGQKKKVLHVVRAPPPEDVIWESMRFEMKPALRRRLQWRSTTAIIVVLIVSIVIITIISTISRQESEDLPNLALCEVSAKAMFLDSDVSEVCGTVDDLTLERPALSERSFLDSQCKSVLPDSFFVTYKSSDGDYLSGSVGYADAYQIDALRSACSDECPTTGQTKCPCIRISSGNIPGCTITEYNENTCVEEKSSKLKGNLLASCYCRSLLARNVEEHGASGMTESYNTDKDMCTEVFQIYSLVLILQILTSLTTASMNKVIELTCKWFADHEGHINFETKELKMMQRNLWSQIFNTVGIPLLVAGRPTTARFRLPIFDGDHKDFMRVADDDSLEVERNWYTDVGAEFFTTFLIMVFFEIYGPLARYHKFLLHKNAYKKLHPDGIVGEENKPKWQKCLPKSIRNVFRVASPFALQSTINKLFAADSFAFGDRYVQVICLVAIMLFVGPGVPILFPLGVLGLTGLYLTDKFLVIKYHARPDIKIGRALQDTINTYFIIGILLHSGFAGWTYCNEVLSRKYEDDDEPSDGSIWEKFEFEASLPLLPAGMLSLGMLLLLPEKSGPSIWETLKRALKFKSHKHPNTALFSEAYEVDMKDATEKEKKLSKREKKLGYRFDSEQMVKYKVTPPPRNKRLRTWEVIKQNGLHTYYRGANPRYSNAIKALEEAQENAKLDDIEYRPSSCCFCSSTTVVYPNESTTVVYPNEDADDREEEEEDEDEDEEEEQDEEAAPIPISGGSGQWATELAELDSMGFSDRDRNIELLTRYNGRLVRVTNVLAGGD